MLYYLIEKKIDSEISKMFVGMWPLFLPLFTGANYKPRMGYRYAGSIFYLGYSYNLKAIILSSEFYKLRAYFYLHEFLVLENISPSFFIDLFKYEEKCIIKFNSELKIYPFVLRNKRLFRRKLKILKGVIHLYFKKEGPMIVSKEKYWIFNSIENFINFYILYKKKSWLDKIKKDYDKYRWIFYKNKKFIYKLLKHKENKKVKFISKKNQKSLKF